MTRTRWTFAAAIALQWAVILASGVSAQQNTFSTLITTPLSIEGLTDNGTRLYTTGRTGGGAPCPVWQINLGAPSLVVVGFIPDPCSPSGLAFNSSGQLFVADADRIYTLSPSAGAPPTARVFASGVPGTNGIAFDRLGNAWTGDGTTGQGRIWRVSRDGEVVEAFRVPPIATAANVAGGVGRDVRTLPPGTVTVTATSRNAADTGGSQPLVANGLAFDGRDDLFIADTARGAIWRVELDNRGNPRSPRGCDDAYPPGTLCLDNIFVAHPLLEGVDGITFDEAGNLWCSVNERNALVVVTPAKRVIEVFRNPRDSVTGLRNVGPFETPTSPVVVGRTVCTANSDGNRRDNFPNTAGEINPAGPARGKISCATGR
jgi:sugar lactone lactonase YvrE